MLFADIIPSCSEVLLYGLGALALIMIGIGQAVQKAGEVAGKLLDNDVAKEVGKGFLESWFDSWWNSK